MFQKEFLKLLVIILFLVMVASIAGYFFQNRQPSVVSILESPTLSIDKKSIIAGDEILMVVDNDAIFNWFKDESQLCDEYNITSVSNRKAFCEEKTSFKNQTRFASVVISPDKTKIGFTIESDTLSPDKTKIGFTIESDTLSPDRVAGIFLRPTGAVHFLTNYYLGNEFVGFSPNGANFVYQGDCFGAMCALYIKNSETFSNKLILSDSEFADGRTRNAVFVRWLSDNEIEYKLGAELKQASF